MSLRYIEASYNGPDEYFITPDNKQIIRVGIDKNPYDPRKENDLLSNVIIAHKDWDKIDNAFEDALHEYVPKETAKEAYAKYITEKCDRIHWDRTPDSWHLIKKNSPGKSITSGFYEEDGYPERYYDDPKLMAEYLMDSYEDFGYDITYMDLIREGCLDETPYILLSGHVRSQNDRYTEVGAYLPLTKVKDEYKEITPETVKRAKSLMDSEVELCRQYVDGEVFFIEEFNRDGSTHRDIAYGFYGDEAVFGEFYKGTKSLGTYSSIEECFEDNANLLNITVDPIPSLEERIHLVSNPVINEDPIPEGEQAAYHAGPEMAATLKTKR